MSSRTRGANPGAGVVAHGSRMLVCLYGQLFGQVTNEGALPSTANELLASPLQIPFRLTIDRIGLCLEAVAGNLLGAIYRDNGDTPVGGARLGITGVYVPIADQKNEIPLLADVQLDPGLYWVAMNWSADNCWRYTPRLVVQLGGTLRAYGANIGVFACPDPCPALVATQYAPLYYVRVKSIP